MSLDVRPDHLEIVKAILKRYIPEYQVIAFGSRVTGKATKTSDLDLCIKANQALPVIILENIRDAFSLSMLPYKVDVLVWGNLSPSFQKIIAEKYCQLQEASDSSFLLPPHE